MQTMFSALYVNKSVVDLKKNLRRILITKSKKKIFIYLYIYIWSPGPSVLLCYYETHSLLPERTGKNAANGQQSTLSHLY